MSLDRLKTFLEVYRQRSMGGAARVLDITQPAVSQHIKILETQLARPLFKRTKRGVEPTAAADDLARDIATQLDGLERAFLSRRALSRSLSGVIHLGAPAEYFFHRLASIIPPLAEEGLRVQTRLGGKQALYQLLDSDEIDLAITASKPDERLFASELLDQERLLLIGGPVLAGRIRGRRVDAELLNTLPCVAYDAELPLIRDYFQTALQAECRVKAIVTAADLRAVVRLCTVLGAWSVVPDYLLKEELARGDLMVLETEGDTPLNQLYLAWKRTSLRSPRVAYARTVIARALAGNPD